jgi:hypothetical protein
VTIVVVVLVAVRPEFLVLVVADVEGVEEEDDDAAKCAVVVVVDIKDCSATQSGRMLAGRSATIKHPLTYTCSPVATLTCCTTSKRTEMSARFKSTTGALGKKHVDQTKYIIESKGREIIIKAEAVKVVDASLPEERV